MTLDGYRGRKTTTQTQQQQQPKDKSFAWFNFVLRSLKRFKAHTVEILILRPRNPCNHWLLCLSIKIRPPHVPQRYFKDFTH